MPGIVLVIKPTWYHHWEVGSIGTGDSTQVNVVVIAHLPVVALGKKEIAFTQKEILKQKFI